MDEEIRSHEEMKMWEFVTKRENMHVINSKWVFVLKGHDNVDDLKSSSGQKEGVEYFEILNHNIIEAHISDCSPK